MISIVGILLAALASFIIGMLWYSKSFFGEAWMKETGLSEAKIKKTPKQKMRTSFIIATTSSLLTAFVLAFIIDLVPRDGIVEGILIGFLAWVGFVATVLVNRVIWEGSSTWKLYLINSFHYLVSLVVMGAILGLF